MRSSPRSRRAIVLAFRALERSVAIVWKRGSMRSTSVLPEALAIVSSRFSS